MHSTLESIRKELEQIALAVGAIGSQEPFSVAHNNWSFPGLTRADLAARAVSLIAEIDARGGDDLEANEELLADYPRRLTFLRTATVPNIWGNPGAGVAAYLITLDGLRQALEPAFGKPDPAAIAAAKSIRRLTGQLRGIEARIADLDPRSRDIDAKVLRIEQAHEAADQLPTDLATLAESRKKVVDLVKEAIADRKKVSDTVDEALASKAKLANSDVEAKAIIERCDAAYRATTSQGLASAFAERARSLSISMWIWVAGLIIALALGAYLGSGQLKHLAEVLKEPSGRQDSTVWVDFLMSLISIGGPIWFAWIATKQTGQRFRLAEDYGYKASISKAYEGYRREAALLDPQFQHRLFSSALTRLDELPLRLVEPDTPGSPWHELAASPLVRNAMATVPDFVNNIISLAQRSLPTLSKESKASAVAEAPESGTGKPS